MKVFVAGATGAVGTPLVPMLVKAGHSVTAMTRSGARADALRGRDVDAVVINGLDAAAVTGAVRRAEPDVVVHHLTSIPDSMRLRRMDEQLSVNNRLRTEITDALLAAAVDVGARRLIAQSFGGLDMATEGGDIGSEDDAYAADPLGDTRRTVEAIRHLERTVTHAKSIEGVVLRFGAFYGPGTAISPTGSMVERVRRRRLPIIGDGAGMWSFCHVHDAATATLAALTTDTPGLYNVVDDEPAPVSEWMPELAAALGARPPRRIPVWMARLAAGEISVMLMTRLRGASNLKAKAHLGWSPSFPSWRIGFRAVLG